MISFKRDVIFEVSVIDTMKPTGQCSLEDFRTLIICFNSVNSIMKKRPERIKGQGRSAGAAPIVDQPVFRIAFHYFKISWYMWKYDNIGIQKENAVNVNLISLNYMNILLHILVKSTKHIDIASLVVSLQKDWISRWLSFRVPLTREIYHITGIWVHG